MKALDEFYHQQPEPLNGCLLALKDFILAMNADITNERKYGMPFFCFKGKMFCYLWVHRKYNLPYIGLVEGKYFEETFLIQEKRSRMKIMLIDPTIDLPIETIRPILQKALNLYQSGEIRIKGM